MIKYLLLFLVGSVWAGEIIVEDETGIQYQQQYNWTQDSVVRIDISEAPITAPTAREMWETSVQPAIDQQCGSCHTGVRAGFASLKKSGADFTAEDTERNYQKFVLDINLDNPPASRLLLKGTNAITHTVGASMTTADPIYTTILDWVNKEKEEKCPDCGLDAPTQYVAYVEQPRSWWAIDRRPVRGDKGQRDTPAKIWLQPIVNMQPSGARIDFLDGWCGADGKCDFGHMSASHDGTQLAFECRLGETGEDWIADTIWNICIAGIGPDGKAINPRVIANRKVGWTQSRSSPFMIANADGTPLKYQYDKHARIRWRDDLTPAFGPGDEWVYLSSRGVDPDTGIDGTRAYHGFDHTNNIIAVRPDGSEIRSVYLNEGGHADFPFFLRNGRLVYHTWNLERTDSHMYTESTPAGLPDFSVHLGRQQQARKPSPVYPEGRPENMWGKAVALGSGVTLGMTGLRMGSVNNFVPFIGDHALGTGLDANPQNIRVLDTETFGAMGDWPQSFCVYWQDPHGQNCVVPRWYEAPSYWPDGRALIGHNPEATYVTQGELMYNNYSSGGTVQERLASLDPYVPHRLGLWLIDTDGNRELLMDPADGYMWRYPVWIGKRQAPPVLPVTKNGLPVEVHIADVPLMFAMRRHPNENNNTSKAGSAALLDTIVALRVLVKEMDGNACTNDGMAYRKAVNAQYYDHPTHLGINNATGYRRLVVPQSLGGNQWGDIPLQADKSAKILLPTASLILFQGIDANGHMVDQLERLRSYPLTGEHMTAAVRRDQYYSQCMTCHGTIDAQPHIPLDQYQNVPFVPLDATTDALQGPAIDLTDPTIERRLMTFQDLLRPRIDTTCTSCHNATTPAGELSLVAEYSGNFPKGKWQQSPLSASAYRDSVPAAERQESYNYSVTYAFLMASDESAYRNEYAQRIADYDPLGDLAPYDSGYQNLFADGGSTFVYLSEFRNPNFGRGRRFPGNSHDSPLIELLSGRDISSTTWTAPDHTVYLTEAEVRDWMGVIDLGFPYMSRCDDKIVPSGPNAGGGWGDAQATDF